MVNNEQAKKQNARDLKFYRFCIAMTFVVSIIIALVVGISNVDSYKLEAAATNEVLNLLMPKQIKGEGAPNVDGMVFYREKNKEYDVEKDEPLKAFNYYYINSEGKKQYLEDGIYYPPEYYMENSNVNPVMVNLGFYFRVQQNLQVLKNVLTVLAVLLALAVCAGLIYVWYHFWSIREDKRIARQKEFNERMNKKN